MRVLLFMAQFLLLPGSSFSDRLISHLFGNYSTLLRPQCEHDWGVVNVSVAGTLQKIINLDEPAQVLNSVFWLRLGWPDCRLVWSPPHYHNRSNVVLDASKVWVPDLVLYDAVNSDSLNVRKISREFGVRVSSNGDVNLFSPAIFQSSCTVDVQYFPFDVQVCQMKFGSWSHNGHEIDLTVGGPVDLEEFDTNGEWNLEAAYAVRNERRYACCPEPYPDVTFYVKIKRRTLFYLINIILPSSALSVLMLLTFLVPPNCTEKVTISLTILLSLMVFSTLVIGLVPPTSQTVPLVGKYLTGNVILITCSCFMAVFVLNLAQMGDGGDRRPPRCLVQLTRRLAHVLCVSQRRLCRSPRRSTTAQQPLLQQESNSLPSPHHADHLSLPVNPSALSGERHLAVLYQISGQVALVYRLLLSGNVSISTTSEKCQFCQEEDDFDVTASWYNIAAVVDRLFLILTFFTIVFLTISFMYKLF